MTHTVLGYAVFFEDLFMLSGFFCAKGIFSSWGGALRINRVEVVGLGHRVRLQVEAGLVLLGGIRYH